MQYLYSEQKTEWNEKCKFASADNDDIATLTIEINFKNKQTVQVKNRIWMKLKSNIRNQS